MIEQIARALYAAMYPLDEDEIDETDTLDLSWTALVPIAETAILPLIEAAVMAERERCALIVDAGGLAGRSMSVLTPGAGRTS